MTQHTVRRVMQHYITQELASFADDDGVLRDRAALRRIEAIRLLLGQHAEMLRLLDDFPDKGLSRRWSGFAEMAVARAKDDTRYARAEIGD